MLARVCVSEAGWQGHEECTVIVHALSNQAAERGIPLRRQICAYAPNSCDRDREDNRKWISHLHPEARRPPPGWPRLSWETHRVRFVAMVITAYRAMIGELSSACPGAYHWGAHWCRACRERMRDSGYVRAGCEMANAWWRRQ